MNSLGESSELEVRLFGEPVVLSSEMELRLSPQQLALVTVVYGHGPRGLSRPLAAQLLWGSDADVGWRQNVRQLLLDIRSRGGKGLICTRKDLLFPCPRVSCDLFRFQRELNGGSLQEAASLVDRGFLARPPGSVVRTYDDWRSGKGATLLRSVRVRASVAWQTAFTRGAWRTAHDAAEALYVLDPDDAPAVERVIEARGRVGEFALAETAFALYVESHASDDGPDQSVIDAIERVRRVAPAGGNREGGGAGPPPFIGRDAALADARAVFGTVEAGRFGFVLIEGESGIGKTRMLQELRREASFRGIRCLHAQPVELESRIPLNPLLDALSTVDLRSHLKALGRPWDAVIGTILPSGVLDKPPPELPPIQESALPRRLMDAFALLLERLAAEQPTLLLIDDLQWADATTVAALQFVQRRWTHGALGVIATVRPRLVTQADPVAQYISGSEGLPVQRIELQELSGPEAAELIGQIGKGEISDETTQRICDLAGLHPLYLTELARDYLAGRLELPERAADEVTIPMSLAQILDARLCHLSDEAMKLAGLLAVAGRPMRLGKLSQLARLHVDEAVDLVEELARWRLVDLDHDRVGITHDLFRHAIYRRLGEARRAINHKAMAAHILADATEESHGALATHYARAGEAESAARHGWAAAERAMASGAAAEAAHFYQLVTDNEGDPTKRAESTAALARALHLTRDLAKANPQLELAATRLRAVGKPREARRMEIRRVEGLGDLGAAPVKELLERLDVIKQEAQDSEDWEGVALALDVELHLLHRDGDVPGIQAVFETMRAIASHGSVEAALLCHAGLALGVLFGDAEEALCSAKRALSLTSEGMSYRLRALLRLLVVLQNRGMLSLSPSQEVVAEARALAARSGDLLTTFSIESNMASAALDAGDLDRAEVLMARSTAMLGAADMELNRFNQANNRAELALARGDYPAAEASFIEASTYQGLNTPGYMNDLVNAGLGLCSLETGHLAEARRREEQLGRPPASWYFDPTTILAFRARLLERRGHAQAAIALLEEHSADLETRLVLAWLKVRALQARTMARHNDPGAREVILQARDRAAALQLRFRTDEFNHLLTRLQP